MMARWPRPTVCTPGVCSATAARAPWRTVAYLLSACPVVAFIGTGVTCGIVYLCYRYATRLLNKLGDVGTLVMMRLAAFILLCIGLQMIWSGWVGLNSVAQS